MKCSACQAVQLPDANFCDECGEPIARPANIPATSTARRSADPHENSGFVEIFSTPDFGELGGIQSLLKSHGFHPFTPSLQAESMSIWTAGVARSFTIHVPANEAGKVRKLLAKQPKKDLPSPEFYHKQWRDFGLIMGGLIIGLIILISILTARPQP
jgi:hypothetical protein